jgi:methionine-rich copper-binding protein CopC
MQQWYKMVLTLACLLVAATSGTAQLSLVSTSPTDGETNVSSPATFQLTFSAALDTNARFEEPEDFFLGIEFWGVDSLGEPEAIQMSPDFKTVTVTGFELPADRKVTVFLTGAKSQAGDDLDRPYVLTFSTGSALPSGSVSGTVSFAGGSGEGSVVALFLEDSMSEDPDAAAIAGPQFTVNYLADGRYQLMSLKNTNGDGNLDPSGGDAIGFYDANGDDEPDVIEISGGNAVTGADVALLVPQPETAGASSLDFAAASNEWAADAILVAIHSGEVQTNGLSYEWSYVYYSPGQDAYRVFFNFGGAIMSDSLHDDHLPDQTALADNWLDSDAATSTAEVNGGGAFRAAFDDAEVDASMEFFHLYDPQDPNAENIVDTGENLAVWRFNYWSESAEEYLNIEVNAVTGELLQSDAVDNVGAANAAAQNWAADAELIRVQSEWELHPDGLSAVWGFVYRSVALDSTIMVHAVSGTALALQPTEYYHDSSWDALPVELCSSVDAVAIAQQESETFRTEHPDFYMFAELSRGMVYDEATAIWRISYHTFAQDYMEVYINAETCAQYVTGVAASAVMPGSYALAQNYPNPFNPSTEIRFELPQAVHVTLTIYNTLGQQIKTLVNSRQAAGSHNLTWDGTNNTGHVVPSGVYIYRIQAGDYIAARKMALTR